MKAEYDFSNLVKNQYARRVKKHILIRIETDTIDYFTNHQNKNYVDILENATGI